MAPTRSVDHLLGVRLALVLLAALIVLPTAAHAEELATEMVVGYRLGKKVKVEVIAVDYERMELATGKAFLAMREAALADGVQLYVYSGFRSMEDQKRLYAAWKEGWGNKAAKPGRSNHQLGKALDLYLGEAGTYAWLEANAKKFGFRRTVPGEPWHWEYVKKAKKKKAKKRR